jgi:hypothetical protein
LSCVYTSKKHLKICGPNQSFGNHLSHLFFIYNVSKTRNIDLGITCDSNLDELLDLSSFKKELPSNAKCLYSELFGGNINESVEKELINIKNCKKILYDLNFNLPEHFWLEGWFYRNDVKPNSEIFDDFKIHDSLLSYQNDKYLDVKREDVVVLHYRKGDFINHSIGWGDLTLPQEYYIKAINEIKKHINPKKYIIISDDPNYFKKVIESYVNKIEVYSDSYLIDWLNLYACKNLICSNSSFCWTAGFFNKKIVIQPKNYLVRNLSLDVVFPPNIYYNNSIIL